jgi:nascent polypeptide-associated complex subunit alpha
MLPGLGGMNPKKMGAMMKQLGIKQEEVQASRVVIEQGDEGKIVIENPQVTRIEMQGQASWQVVGEASESGSSGEDDDTEEASEDDIKLVMEKTGKGEEEARKALEESGGDIAEAIVKLSE